MKYSKEFDRQLETEIAAILAGSEDAMTLTDIGISLGMNGLTTQKIARIIKKIDETQRIITQKGKDNLNRYKSYAVHQRQGYDMAVYNKMPEMKVEKRESTYFNPGTEGWIAPRFRRYHLDDNL